MLKPSLPSTRPLVPLGAARFARVSGQLFVKKTNKKFATNTMDAAKSSIRDQEPTTNSHPGHSDAASPHTKDGQGGLPRQDSIPVAQRADGLGKSNIRSSPSFLRFVLQSCDTIHTPI
jgi:hypothetical protein